MLEEVVYAWAEGLDIADAVEPTRLIALAGMGFVTALMPLLLRRFPARPAVVRRTGKAKAKTSGKARVKAPERPVTPPAESAPPAPAPPDPTVLRNQRAQELLLAFTRGNSVETAWELGLLDLQNPQFLAEPPFGLFFVMPYAVAANRPGFRRDTPAGWPEFASLSRAERDAAGVIFTCLTGSEDDRDRLSDAGSPLGLGLLNPLLQLGFAVESYWGLEEPAPDRTVFDLIYRGGTPPMPKWRIVRARLATGNSELIAAAVQVVRLVVGYGLLPSAEEGAAVKKEIRSVPALLLVRGPRRSDAQPESPACRIGGLPCLGRAPWPRAKSGEPLAFAAQMDLAEVKAATGFQLLPDAGSLAFFIGNLSRKDGRFDHAVVYVDDTGGGPTAPPGDMRPVSEVFAADLTMTGRGEVLRDQFPCWPLSLHALGIPYTADRAERRQAIKHFARFGTLHAMLTRWLARNSGGPGLLRWFCARYLLTVLKLDFAEVEAPQPPGADGSPFDARKQWAYEERQTLLNRFGRFIDEFEHWIGERSFWQEMTSADVEQLGHTLERVWADFSVFQKTAWPNSVNDFYRIMLRALASAPDDVFALEPDPVRQLVDDSLLLPGYDETHHQMFGRGASVLGGDAFHIGEHMLLQLAGDPVAGWFPSGVCQFWISPTALEERDWSAVTFLYEIDDSVPTTDDDDETDAA
ncbi:MAG: DUF1963 domain-containing protein [Methylobacteriaceae bacterium]|nr:DUF1963 domain-containing protein [Methylobacteriaceae bacterium]